MIAILGGGLAGLSAGYHLCKEHIILEQENQAGGLCRSVNIEGFVFDYAPHILFSRDPYIKNLIHDLLKENIITHQRQAYIFMEKTYVKYPFEVNLHKLPKKIIKECIDGVINKKDIEPNNFLEWIYTTFGKGIADHYMIPYNQKIWKYDLNKMNTEWILGRVPSPSIEEMKRGSIGEFKKDYGPNSQFWYPKYGGIGALANKFLEKKINLSLNSKVLSIKPSENRLELLCSRNSKNKIISSNKVLSSLPLPEIIKMIENVPGEIKNAAKSLVYNSMVCINFGITRPKIIDKHWLYFPEKELIFNRVSFPMNFSPYTTPNGKSSILAEVTYREKHVNIEKIRQKCLEDLIKIDIIKEKDIVEVSDCSNFKYAYVIYDLNHKKNVKIIHDYLRSIKIIPIGRFGEWEYLNMDKSILSGRNAAKKIDEG